MPETAPHFYVNNRRHVPAIVGAYFIPRKGPVPCLGEEQSLPDRNTPFHFTLLQKETNFLPSTDAVFSWTFIST